jgi:hypothetical protein
MVSIIIPIEIIPLPHLGGVPVKLYCSDSKHNKVRQLKSNKGKKLENPTTVKCAVCKGVKLCITCEGEGCMDCDFTGRCSNCCRESWMFD